MAMSDKTLEQARARNQVRGDHAMRIGGIDSSFDYVVLADGSLFVVQRTNLAAAKEMLAAQKAALRRMAE